MGVFAEIDLQVSTRDKNDSYRKITQKEIDTLDFGLDEEEKRLYEKDKW